MEVKELFSRLKKEAQCSICVHTVNHPKSLPCLHSFCLDCINKYAATKRSQGNTAFGCPECSAIVDIPDGDSFDDFPTSFYLNRLVDILVLGDETAERQTCSNCDENAPAASFCFECKTFLCSACLAAHNRMKASRSHRQTPLNNLAAGDVKELIQRPVMCEKQNHRQEPLEFYCQDCQVCICNKCSATTHNQHVKLDIADAADQHKAEIIQSIQKVRDRIAHSKQGMDKEQENFDSFKQEVESSRDKVRATMSDLYRILKEYETIFMERLDDSLTEQREAHAAKQKNFELSLCQMTSSVDYMEAIVQRNIGAEILQSRISIAERAGKILQENKLRSSKALRVDFETNAELCETLRQNSPGWLLQSFTDPPTSTAEGKGLHEAECGETAQFTVTTKDADGELCHSQQDRVSVHIQIAAGRQVEADVESNSDGRYHVTYTPMKHGESHVTIRVNGHVLPGSPWHVRVAPHQYQCQTLSSFGSRGRGKGEFLIPWGVAVSSTGNVAVADSGNKRVQVFSSAGRYLGEFGQQGQSHEQLSCPIAVAYLDADHILVADSRLNKVFLFKENGEFVKRLNPGQYQSPFGISVNRDDHVIVCDTKSKKVLVLSPDGNTLLQSFQAPDCDTAPFYVVQNEDKFFVSYPNRHCIKVFDAAGNYVRDIGRRGAGDGQLNSPSGVAIDKFNNLVVVDEKNHRLQIFTPEGEFVSAIGGKGTELGQFSSPQGVAVSREGQLYVTDFSNCRVKILS